MTVIVRNAEPRDFDAVLALNNAAGPTILPLDAAGLKDLFERACHFRLIEVDGTIAGFLPALREDSGFQSRNFLWFRNHYPSFIYIDRIVVAKPCRGLWLGRVFYADVTSYAELRVPVLTCEVFLEPRDDVALLFHGAFGFQEVGQRTTVSTGRRVALLAKELCSFPYVRDTYLRGTAASLPELPWTAERRRVPILTSAAKTASGA